MCLFLFVSLLRLERLFISQRDNAVIFNYIQVFQTIQNVASLKNRQPPSIVPHVYNNPQELVVFFPQDDGEESRCFLFFLIKNNTGV